MDPELPAASQNENEQISLSIKQNRTFVVFVNECYNVLLINFHDTKFKICKSSRLSRKADIK